VRTLISFFATAAYSSFFLTSRLFMSSTLFPYTTLFRSIQVSSKVSLHQIVWEYVVPSLLEGMVGKCKMFTRAYNRLVELHTFFLDRKSTRLNSSHVKTSYAVFCLKKEKKQDVFCCQVHY